MLAGAVYLVAAWLGRHSAPRLAGVFALGMAMRLVLIASPPLANITDDYYRYLWDGWAFTQGLNPYQYSPGQALASLGERTTTDPRLADAAIPAKEVLHRVNHPNMTTIYPPVAQAGFAFASLIKPFSVYALRSLFLVSDLATFVILVALLRRLQLSAGLVFLYWWNPIVLKWIYAEAHMDVMLFPFLLLALLAVLSYRPVLAGGSLAMAAGVKLWPVLLLPFVVWHLRADRRRMLIGAVTAAALTLIVLAPVLLARPTAQEGIWTYARTWENNDGIYSLVEGAFSLVASRDDARSQARWAVTALLAAWIPVVILGQSGKSYALMRGSLLAVVALFLLSPTQFPWYYTWILPLIAFWPVWPLLAYTALLPLYDLTPHYPWLVWAQHLPFWILLAW
ncbi:MAG: glycosyltransferase 87 family protein, partial [Acidobacteriales bacterium]|nr:glycosyltransferase 87 family protein [Terriglobales bacterium]